MRSTARGRSTRSLWVCLYKIDIDGLREKVDIFSNEGEIKEREREREKRCCVKNGESKKKKLEKKKSKKKSKRKTKRRRKIYDESIIFEERKIVFPVFDFLLDFLVEKMKDERYFSCKPISR